MKIDEDLIKKVAYLIWKENGERENEDLLNWILAKESLGMYTLPFEGEKFSLEYDVHFAKIYKNLEEIKNIFIEEAIKSKSIRQILENNETILGRCSLFDFFSRNFIDHSYPYPYNKILEKKTNYIKLLGHEWSTAVIFYKKISLSLEEVENSIFLKYKF